MTLVALTALASQLGIPSNYIKKCPPLLQLAQLNYWNRTIGPDQLRLLTDGSETPSIQAFTRPDAGEVLDIERAISCVEDELGRLTDLDYTMVSADIDLVRFSVVGPKQGQPKRGDIFRAGVAFEYSPSDKRAMTIRGMNYRLVCTNGAYSVETVKSSRRHTPADPYQWIQENTAIVWQAADSQFERLRVLAETRLPTHDRGELVDHVFNELRIPLVAREYITDRMLTEGADTMYDFFNHITYVASHSIVAEEDPRLQVRLMSTAAQLTDHPAICETCMRLL